MLQGWTDYPFEAAGDAPHQIAQIRRVEVISYHGDKYCEVRVESIPEIQTVKAGYIYRQPGRCGKSATFSRSELNMLPSPSHLNDTSFS